MSPFQIPPAYNAYPKNNPGKTFQLTRLSQKQVILNQWTKRTDFSSEKISKTPFVLSFPDRQEILNISNMSIAFPWNLLPTFDSDLVATVRQKCLPLLRELLFQQS